MVGFEVGHPSHNCAIRRCLSAPDAVPCGMPICMQLVPAPVHS